MEYHIQERTTKALLAHVYTYYTSLIYACHGINPEFVKLQMLREQVLKQSIVRDLDEAGKILIRFANEDKKFAENHYKKLNLPLPFNMLRTTAKAVGEIWCS